MKTCNTLGLIVGTLAALALVLPATVAKAGDGDLWMVEGTIQGDEGMTTDLSGIACATDNGFPRTCVVIDDELQAAQVVTLHDGKIDADGQHMIKLIDDKFAKKQGKPPKALELDGEGVAFADGYFYVIGSHGKPRKKKKTPEEIAARIKADSKLIRFRLDGMKARDLAVSTALGNLIAANQVFNESRDKELEDGGITVEGVAVVGDRLYAGFRGPLIGPDQSQAVIMSVALGHMFGDAPAQAELQPFALGDDRGVRDLAVIDNGILILAGPAKSKRGTYSIFWWDGQKSDVKNLKDLPNYPGDELDDDGKPVQLKPEALLVLARNGNMLRVLVLMDSAKGGNPREFEVKIP